MQDEARSCSVSSLLTASLAGMVSWIRIWFSGLKPSLARLSVMLNSGPTTVYPRRAGGATNVPLPRCRISKPSVTNSRSARCTTRRLIPSCSLRLTSVGSMSPGFRLPATISARTACLI